LPAKSKNVSESTLLSAGTRKLHDIDHPAIDFLLENLELTPRDWGQRFPKHRPFAFFCSYWPEEITMALGWEAFRVLPRGAGVPTRLPTYCCSVARGCLEMGEAGAVEMPAGFAHSCDTIQCLGQIWSSAVNKNTVMFVPPVALGSPKALNYLVAEMENVARRLEKISGRVLNEQSLRSAIVLNNRVRRLVAKLDELRPRLPSPLVAALVRAGQVTPRAAYAHALEELLPILEGWAVDEPERKRVLISGAVLESEKLYELIEDLGGRVVADDSCTGFRHFDRLASEDDDPMRSLAERLILRAPCPCRHRSLEARATYLTELARSRRADAVILVLRKYCDPHAWDAVSVSETLRQANIPVLILELEGASPGERERTRLQAFMESL